MVVELQGVRQETARDRAGIKFASRAISKYTVISIALRFLVCETAPTAIVKRNAARLPK